MFALRLLSEKLVNCNTIPASIIICLSSLALALKNNKPMHTAPLTLSVDPTLPLERSAGSQIFRSRLEAIGGLLCEDAGPTRGSRLCWSGRFGHWRRYRVLLLFSSRSTKLCEGEDPSKVRINVGFCTEIQVTCACVPVHACMA